MAERRKSPWNLILVPLTILGAAAAWALLALLLFSLQQSLVPGSAFLSSYTRAGAILMFVPLVFPSLALGMMIANLAAWCIPRVRRIFEEEARRQGRASFGASMKKLGIALAALGALCGPISLVGALNYFYVTPERVALNPLFSLKEKSYSWSDVIGVETRCIAERRNLHLNYRLKMADRAVIDLMEEPRLRFAGVYHRIRPHLEGRKDVHFTREITKAGVRRLGARYSPENARRLLEVLRTDPAH